MSSCSLFSAASLMVGKESKNGGNITQNKAFCFEGTKQRIKKMFDKVELSISSYDTAWVAMIPSPSSPRDPLFPQCLDWLLDNQLVDGSWGPADHHPLLIKDSLLSTLACVLVLKQWGAGEEQIKKGLQFIESHFASANDDRQHSPIGFDIIFPSLIENAQKLDLNLLIGAESLTALMQKQDLELKSGYESNSERWRAYSAFISEGLMGKSQDWEMVMKYQRKNGSLFNSPATTAAAYARLKNPNCLNYLHTLLDKFGNAVPTVYPLDIYARLSMVDSLERLGIDRHFSEEIRSVLNETYKLWLQGEEDIFLEPTTCAMAFRLLRLHGYEVSSDALTQYSEEKFSDSLQGYLKDVGAVLELYKASEIITHSDDLVLQEQNFWTRHLLMQELTSSSDNAHKAYSPLYHEAEDALRFPYHTNLDRVLHRRFIESCNVNPTKVLKTTYSCLNFANKEFLKLAVEDFNLCQSLHREEFEQYKRWIVENRLDKLEFHEQKMVYCYLTAAATLFSPELSDARLAWAKNGLLLAITDDFYDIWGSEEEQINLIQFVEQWHADNVSTNCCSERVEILCSAVHDLTCDIADKALKLQGYSVKSHFIELWLETFRSHLKEAQWSKTKYMPSIDEYMKNGCVSFALGPITLPPLFLVGPKLPEETIESPQYKGLFELLSFCGRLLNDIISFKREFEQGKLNSVTLRMICGANSEEEAIKEIKGLINEKRRELLRMVLQEKGGPVPRACKDVYWKMAKTLHVTYLKDDWFHSYEMHDETLNILDAVLKDPIILK